MLKVDFSLADYLVFAAMIVGSLFIGVYHACVGGRNNEEYLMGGRNIGVIPMAISLCASFNSAYMILGIPSEIYSYGLEFYIMIFGTGIGVFLAGEVWIPVLYRLKIISMYEYFELRFGSRLLRLIMTLIFIIKTVMYLGMVLYAPTMALASVTRIDWQVSILILGISSTLYTTIGGMKAVVWTDVFQIFIVFGGILAIMIQGVIKVGGWANVLDIAERGNRTELFDLSIDPFERHNFLNLLFGTLIMWGSPYVCSQYLVQRCVCLPSIAKAKMALYINYLGQFVMTTLVVIIGLVMYAYYVSCDPVLAGITKKRDALIPLFVIQEFSNLPGVAGLFISCLFSGALSTLDSALNGLAAVTWEEVKGLRCFRNINKKNENNMTKLLSVVYGLMAIGLAFGCHNMGSLISVGSRLFGACMGPMFALCLLSAGCPLVNRVGAITGLLLGQCLNMWLSMGALIYDPGTPALPLQVNNCSVFNMSDTHVLHAQAPTTNPDDISWIYILSYNVYPVIGFVGTVLITLVTSLVTGGSKEINADDWRYFHPLAWKLFVKCIRPDLRGKNDTNSSSSDA